MAVPDNVAGTGTIGTAGRMLAVGSLSVTCTHRSAEPLAHGTACATFVGVMALLMEVGSVPSAMAEAALTRAACVAAAPVPETPDG
ncbi:hypothetical protein D3C81_1867010 [compost metagenome]